MWDERGNALLLDHANGKCHLAVTGTTKDRTVREEHPGLIRRKARFACSAFADLDIEIEISAM